MKYSTEEVVKEKFDIIISVGQSDICDPTEYTDGGYMSDPDILRMTAVGLSACVKDEHGDAYQDFALCFARKYKQERLAPDRKILLIRTFVDMFSDKRRQTVDVSDENNAFDTALSFNKNNRIVAVLWLGRVCYDSGNGDQHFGDLYYSALSALTEEFRNTAKRDCPVIFGCMPCDEDKKNSATRDAVYAAIEKLCRDTTRAAFADTKGIGLNCEKTGFGDMTSSDRRVAELLGDRYYAAYSHIMLCR